MIGKKALGLNIQRARQKRGITQIELSKEMGHASAAYISFIEKGERNINLIDAVKLANILRISLNELIELEGREYDDLIQEDVKTLNLIRKTLTANQKQQ